MGNIFVVKGPTNWWRVVGMAAVPLFLYTTWRYAETAATLAHLREHFHLDQKPGVHAPANPTPTQQPKFQ